MDSTCKVIRLSDRPRKYRVLCFYRYDHIRGNNVVSDTDSLMIEVSKPEDIPFEFENKMDQLLRVWNPYRVGPKPFNYRLLRYLPENMKATF